MKTLINESLFSWIRRSDNLKCSIPSKLVYRFNTFSINVPIYILMEIDNLVLKFINKYKEMYSQDIS